MFSFNEDLTFTNTQRVSNKWVVKFTKRAQTISIEIVKVKKAKIHEKSIELLISLNFETTHFEQKNALLLNNHVLLQSNRIDSFINVFNFTNLNISNQSLSESFVVEIVYDFVDAFSSVSVSTHEIEFNAAQQWLSRNASLINNHSTAAIILNIFDTFLSSSFIDIVSLFFDENLFSQITGILQNFFERARREVRQQVRNVYSYDFVFNQIIRSFFNDALSTRSSHLLFYFFSTIKIQISTSAIRKVKQKWNCRKQRYKSRSATESRDVITITWSD
jgi:hypothetical protein